MDIQKMIEDNPGVMIGLVCGIALLFAAGFIFAKAAASRKRKRLREESGMAEIVFDKTVRAASRMITDMQFEGYKIYSVNGEEPMTAGNGVMVKPGLCTIEAEYADTDYAGRRRSATTLHGRQIIELQAGQGMSYKVSFNEKTGEFEVQEA